MSENVDEPSVDLFISYTHKDEEAFGILGPLKAGLENFYQAKFGRSLSIFTDAALVWGKNWREQLQARVSRSLLFMPIATANYFESAACREEFEAFHSAAKNLGVEGLIIPVVPISTEVIRRNSGDFIVDYVESVQYRNIYDAFLAGFDSSLWRRTMDELATKLNERLFEASLALESIGGQGGETVAPSVINDDEDGDGDGLADLMVSFEDATQEVARLAEELKPAIENLGRATQLESPPTNGTPKQFLAWSIRVADKLSGPSQEIGRIGAEMYEKAKELDVVFAGMARLGDDLPPSTFDMAGQLRSFARQLDGLELVDSQLQSMLQSMLPVEKVSSAIGRSLKHTRLGVKAVRDTLGILNGWADLYA
ncbi:hypothetical protein BKD30_06710 [Tersicoccus phoenicis]|uniref:TIR domain-containing protein n=1 Tax=Tersicoccus phoenicis TaxID=554083 RepID=A0A1R1LC81_9MICC|nr:toll/interleukin-1 receptor domain-containing protein [Tersicoccus phoenicis]OMH25146.1 hypothetical protein BKD30_06710 [Tersicoccus phoenicis]